VTEPKPSFPEVVLAEAIDLAMPLAQVATARGPETLLRTLGWDPPRLSAAIEALESLPDEIEDMLDGLDALAAETDDDQRLQKVGELAQQISAMVVRLSSLPTQLSDAFTGFEAAGFDDPEDGLVIRLLDWLVVTFLARSHNRIHAFCLLLGLIEYIETDAEQERKRIATTIAKVHWERLPLLVTDPGQVADDVYDWSTEVDHELLIARLSVVAGSFGLISGGVEQSQEVHDALGRPANQADELRLPIVQTRYQGGLAEAGLLLSEAPPQGTGPGMKKKGLAVVPYGQGSVSLDFNPRPGLRITLGVSGGVQGGLLLTIRPSGIDFDLFGGGGGEAAFTVKLAKVPASPTETAVILAGSPNDTRFEAGQAFVAVTGAVDPGGPEFRVQGGLVKGAIVILPGKGDGFLKKILPEKGITAELDLDVTWSTRTGFHFKGGLGLEVELPVNLSIADVLKLQSVFIRVRVAGEGLQAVVAVSATVKIGPISGAIERVGARAKLDIASDGSGSLGPFEPSLAFQPPSGAGMSVKAGPVTGGGYLFFDPEVEQYAGILQLSIQVVNITAIGLLTTRLPDPSGAPGATKKGFSLLVIITAEFPPIQLGYGFALIGLGGLLGIHRTVVIEPLRSGVRDGTVNSILFPQDPIARAPQIISQLRTIFPPAEGRFVFGPMVKIGWGPKSLLELSAAVVLELMSPIKLVILGRIQVALPDKKDPVLNLRLDIVGVLDFDKGEVSVDASLVDSRLVVFVITGDMALRVGWGASKMFALAAGGFHPAFQPPPGFPSLRRLGIALSDSNNPRLRMDTYMALTANTIQFGAGLDVYVGVDTPIGSFSVAANMVFDALIQFQPFELVAELGASVDVMLNREPLLHAALHATFSGPRPWHAVGYAEFNFLGNRRIDVELTSGTPAEPSIPEISPGDVLDEVVAAFASADAWATLPPPDADRVVSIRDQAPGDAIHVHPLGALSARQRVLPLGQTIDRFGTSVMRPTAFTLKTFDVAGAQAPPETDLYDDFAPGQFLSLTDDERVARPAFEAMRSGGSVKATRFRIPKRPDGTPDTVPGQSGYQESVVDVEPTTKLRTTTIPTAGPEISAETLAALVHGGAAARAETRSNGPREFRGPKAEVGVATERWLVADADTLRPVPGAPDESAAEAHERLDRRPADAAPAAVVPTGEAG